MAFTPPSPDLAFHEGIRKTWGHLAPQPAIKKDLPT